MLQCSQPVADACWPRSKMDFRSNEAGRTALGNLSLAPLAKPSSRRSVPFPLKPPRRGRRSFVADHENRNALSRFYRRAEALPRRLHHRPADQPGRTRPRRRQCRQSQCRADRTRRCAHQGAGQGHRVRQETRRPGKIQARRASVRCLSAAEAAGARQRAAQSRRTISAGAITACSMSRRRRIPTCAACAFRTAS